MAKFFQKFLAVFLALILLNLQTFASPFAGSDFSDEAQELVNFNEDAIYSEFQEIDALSDMLLSNDVSADEITDNSMLENVSMNASLPLSADEDGTTGPPLGIPSFLWGCILSWVGILIVYFLTEENKDETKKAVWGCVAGAVAYTLFYVIVWGVGAAASASTY
ncbi:hypothetical protein ACE1ET_13485 [Saccharicrinis sp. FJH62]|uniref:hypothetical protein n=1 Tax=Saccharicrinis sp. FJH62 TaxID=3344657 RepID=UPI0035D45936